MEGDLPTTSPSPISQASFALTPGPSEEMPVASPGFGLAKGASRRPRGVRQVLQCIGPQSPGVRAERTHPRHGRVRADKRGLSSVIDFNRRGRNSPRVELRVRRGAFQLQPAVGCPTKIKASIVGPIYPGRHLAPFPPSPAFVKPFLPSGNPKWTAITPKQPR